MRGPCCEGVGGGEGREVVFVVLAAVEDVFEV